MLSCCWWRHLLIGLVLILQLGSGFRFSTWGTISRLCVSPARSQILVRQSASPDLFGAQLPVLPTVVAEDVSRLASLLQNITHAFKDNEAQALTLASQNADWLLSCNVPKVAQQLLDDIPGLREDMDMADSYSFLLNFLESLSKEAAALTRRNQNILRQLFESMKTNEATLDTFIANHRANLTSPEFMLYLDTEIQNQEPTSEMRQVLAIIQLRLLEEYGKSFGVDMQALPRLAASESFSERKTKTLEHIEKYDREGKLLLLQTLQLLMKDLQQRHQRVDMTLLKNLKEIENIIKCTL